MEKVTKEFLKEKSACRDGYEWWLKNCDGLDNVAQIKKLAEHRFDWANWLIVRMMEYKEYVSYAVFAAEQVIDIYEKKYPDDKRPRNAIEAAKKCIKDPSKANKAAAADAAYAAAYDAGAAAADAAAYATYAAYAAAAAAYDAYATAAAAAAYDAYAAAAADARESLQAKIIAYGIESLAKGK